MNLKYFGHQYDRIDGGFGWSGAVRDAENRLGRLAVFRSKSDLNEALELFSIPSGWNYFIGLRRDDENSPWKWIDGSPLNYDWWAPGWPSTTSRYGIIEHIPPHKYVGGRQNQPQNGYIIQYKT